MGACYTKRRRIQTTREHLDFFSKLANVSLFYVHFGFDLLSPVPRFKYPVRTRRDVIGNNNVLSVESHWPSARNVFVNNS